jgi:acetyl esterase/lipase
MPREFTYPAFDDPAGLTPARLDSGVTEYRDIRFVTELGYRPLYLDLAVPAARPAPVVVYIHGGAWMMNDNRPGAVGELDFDGVLDRLLGEGFAVARVQYRLSGDAAFPACLHDVKAAVRYLRANAGALGLDAERIFSFGDSAGGHLALLLATTADEPALEGTRGATGVSSRVAGTVAWYPVTSIGQLVEQSLDDAYIDRTSGGGPESLLIGADVATHPELAAAASPITYVTPASSPALLIHGDSDHIVPHGQSVVLRQAYEAAGVPVEFITVQGADHCFVDADIPPIVERSVAFLRERAFGA